MCDPAQLQGDEAMLFEEYGERLQRIVDSQVVAPRAVIEDACANAWLILLRRQPRRNTIWSWLKVVAIREAWRLGAREQLDVSYDEMVLSAQDSVIQVEALAEFYEELARLEHDVTTRQRRLVLLHAVGFKYTEIAAITGDSVRTVERQLRRARERLRRRECDPGVKSGSCGPTAGMHVVTYRDRPAAYIADGSARLAPSIEALELDHPIRRWATCLGYFALSVDDGSIPGEYTAGRAGHFARCALIPQDSFLALDDHDDAILAEHFGVPLEQIAERRFDMFVASGELFA